MCCLCERGESKRLHVFSYLHLYVLGGWGCKMGLWCSGAQRSATSIHCTSEQTTRSIYCHHYTADTLHFKLTLMKRKYSSEFLTANLSSVVLLVILFVVHGSVKTTATLIAFIEISLFLLSGSSLIKVGRLFPADICSIPMLSMFSLLV